MKQEVGNKAVETDTCIICGKKTTAKTCFSYNDEVAGTIFISDCCYDEKCIDEYTDRFFDPESSVDPEELWQKQQDDLWEADVLWKED